MIIAKNDEDKRSRVWNYVTGITTVLIIIVAGYFIYQGFFGNPLEGKWKHDESDMILEVDDHNEAELDWKNLIDGKDVDVELGYTLDIKAKQITFTVKQEELDETAKELGDNVTASDRTLGTSKCGGCKTGNHCIKDRGTRCRHRKRRPWCERDR